MVVSAVVIGIVVAAVTGVVVALVAGAHLRHVADGAGQGAEREAAMRAAVDQQLTVELHRLADLVGQVRTGQAAQHGEMVARLEETARATSSLSDAARQLREVLANPRARGQWGERMTDDVLQLAGFVEGVNYVRQRTLPDGSRPDVTFFLPEGRMLHLDVKFPIEQYAAAVQEVGAAERAAHERAFLAAVRDHVKAVAGRGYADPATTPGYALVFIPNEAVYGFVLGADPSLVDVALQHRVVLCSPFTLFAVLAVIRQAVDTFRLGQASQEILQCLSRFRLQWEKFSDHLDKVDRQLDTARRSLDELAGVRRRQLERHLDAIDAIDRGGVGLDLAAVDRDTG